MGNVNIDHRSVPSWGLFDSLRWTSPKPLESSLLFGVLGVANYSLAAIEYDSGAGQYYVHAADQGRPEIRFGAPNPRPRGYLDEFRFVVKTLSAANDSRIDALAEEFERAEHRVDDAVGNPSYGYQVYLDEVGRAEAFYLAMESKGLVSIRTGTNHPGDASVGREGWRFHFQFSTVEAFLRTEPVGSLLTVDARGQSAFRPMPGPQSLSRVMGLLAQSFSELKLGGTPRLEALAVQESC